MERVKAVLRALGVRWTEEQLAGLERYRDLLARWNEKVGLLSRGEDPVVHIIDSLKGLPVVAGLPGTSIADIGSGGGLPGIPLSLFLGDRRVFLVERAAKKAGFLLNAAAISGAGNIEIIDRDIKDAGVRFDGLVFRALGDLKEYWKTLLDAVVPGGWLVGYKGRREVLLGEIEGLVSEGSTVEIVPAPSPPAFGGEARPEPERTFLIVRTRLRSNRGSLSGLFSPPDR